MLLESSTMSKSVLDLLVLLKPVVEALSLCEATWCTVGLAWEVYHELQDRIPKYDPKVIN